MNWKNAFLHILRYIPKKKSLKHERILVVSTTGLGDTLWATPALESLKKSNPSCFLAVLTSPIGYEVLKTSPFLDSLFILPKKLLSNYFLFRSLRKCHFDTVLIFHASQRVVFPLVSLLGASSMIGTEGLNKGLDRLFTKVLAKTHQHEIARRLDLIHAIRATTHRETLSFIPNGKPVSFDQPTIILHPGSKDAFKRWPIAFFAKTGLFFQKKGFSILIAGQKSEKPLMEELSRLIPGSILGNPEQSLHEFGRQLEQAACLICNDSGPMHLAFALQCKTVAIFSATDPDLCGPYRASFTRILHRPPTCFPCLKKRCQEPFCLLQIHPDEVIQAAQDLLAK